MLAVYAIVNGNETGWGSARTLGLLGAAAALLVAFLAIESRVSSPLMPLSLFRNRNVSAANVVGVLMAGGLFAWFFFSALYLQQILGYTPLEVGLAYLPSMVIWGGSSLFSDKLVMRFGIKAPLVTGLALMAVGLVLFARTPVDGSLLVDVLPGTIAIGLGAGIAFNPLLLAAMSGVARTEFGLASGVVNTAFMMGGALALAALASVAAARSDSLRSSGDDELAAPQRRLQRRLRDRSRLRRGRRGGRSDPHSRRAAQRGRGGAGPRDGGPLRPPGPLPALSSSPGSPRRRRGPARTPARRRPGRGR